MNTYNLVFPDYNAVDSDVITSQALFLMEFCQIRKNEYGNVSGVRIVYYALLH